MQALFVLKNGHTVLVRPATLQDAPELTGLMRAIYGTANTVLTTLAEFDQLGSLNAQLTRIQYYTQSAGSLLLVAEIEGRLVGSLDFSNGQRQRIAHTGEFNMGVAPAYQNQGIGRRLIQVMLDWSAANPLIEKIKLTAFASNHNGLHLYKSLGFVEEGRGVREIKLEDGSYLDVINLYKNVKS